MEKKIEELFSDKVLVTKIKTKLPYFFQIAELENSRAGKLGMEVGSAREKIIASLLVYKFGERNVDYNNPITDSEVDVKLFGVPLSIKTLTGKNADGLKLIWTVDATKADMFARNYSPSCDMLLVQIDWGKEGGFYYIPQKVQVEILEELGYKRYMKLPKAGINPRGVSMSNEALQKLLTHFNALGISVNWQRVEMSFNPLTRWIDLWQAI